MLRSDRQNCVQVNLFVISNMKYQHVNLGKLQICDYYIKHMTSICIYKWNPKYWTYLPTTKDIHTHTYMCFLMHPNTTNGIDINWCMSTTNEKPWSQRKFNTDASYIFATKRHPVCSEKNMNVTFLGHKKKDVIWLSTDKII